MVNAVNLESMYVSYLTDENRLNRNGGEPSGRGPDAKLTNGVLDQQDSITISKDAQTSFKKYIMPQAVNHTNFQHSAAFEKLAGLNGKTPIITMPIIL